jgi:hypothetical protein
VHAWTDGERDAHAAARAQILTWGRLAAPRLERVVERTGDAALTERVRADPGALEPRR